MRVKSRLGALVVATTITCTMSVVGLAQPASATMSQCPNGWFCIWQDANYQGHFARFQIGTADLTVPIGGFNFNDQTTAVWNRTSSIWCTYEHVNYGGAVRSWNPNQANANLTGIGWNDRISSLRRCPS